MYKTKNNKHKIKMEAIMKFQEISPFARYVRYIKLEQNTYFPPFVPMDARIFYVCQGEGLIEVEDNIISLNEGQLLFINSGVKYCHKPCDATYLAINFDFTNNFSHLDTPIHNINLLKTKHYNLLENIQFEDAKCFNSFFVFSNCQTLFEELSHIEKEFISKLPFYRAETSALLKSVLAFLARNAEREESKKERFNIEEVVSYIQKHYNEPLSNSYLAKKFHYHPNYLSAEFKRCIGTPLHKYILETRILKAGSMIESGYKNLSEISSMCGFSDVNYFSRYFKKSLGMSPTKFIKVNKK